MSLGLRLCLLSGILTSCVARSSTQALVTLRAETTSPPPSASSPAPSPQIVHDRLFLPTEKEAIITDEPFVVRSRLVKLDLGLLFDGHGQARTLDRLPEITLEMFPDVSFVGVITHLEQNSNSYTWSGYLKNVELSYFTLVLTAGAFIGHFASPQGVYEVSKVGNDTYRVILIDQSQMLEGDG